ncbi:unnamed protein product [Chrysoparadoxa australica]
MKNGMPGLNGVAGAKEGCWRRLTARRLAVAVTALAAFIGYMNAPQPKHTMEITLKSPKASTLTEEQIATFHEEGAIMASGVLEEEELNTLLKASENVIKSEGWRSWDWLFGGPRIYTLLLNDLYLFEEGFAKTVFHTALPSIAAQLMDEEKSVRVLKDAFFSYSPGKKGCTWHVDGEYFWPTVHNTTGVTAWIALQDIKASDGGGLQVAPKTHRPEPGSWAYKCWQVIAAQPERVCQLDMHSPECIEKFSSIGETWDMKAGDVVLFDRWAFHRAYPFLKEHGDSLLRYTVRFIPSDARARGAVHESVGQGELFDTPYHAQVWPQADEREFELIKNRELLIGPVEGELCWVILEAMFNYTMDAIMFTFGMLMSVAGFVCGLAWGVVSLPLRMLGTMASMLGMH